MDEIKDHFQGKAPLEHVVSAQANGVEASLEIHGAETPGVRFSFLDAARETIVGILLLVLALDFFHFPKMMTLSLVSAWGIAWAFWKGSRSTWLSWMRLERLHRIASEEKQEIETNRAQEREELQVLYRAKGFEGALLEQVVDVLMADQERLLRVMLQEEMGFRLHENQHPIFMGVGAFAGALAATLAMAAVCYYDSEAWFITLTIGISFILGFIYAKSERNSALRGGTWSAMVTAVSAVALTQILKIAVQIFGAE